MTSVFLSHRGVLSLQGEDRYAFLQGLITNDIHLIKKTGILFSALLSPQGRFLHDFFIIEREETLYLTPEKERLPDLLSILQRYKLRSRLQLTDESVSMGLFAAWGETCPPSFIPDPRLKEMGYVELFSVPDFPKENGSLEDYDRHRIELGVPDGSRDLIVDKAIVLENNYHELQAMHWEKGCYLGQELMARTHHRGLIRKRLMPVVIEGVAPFFGTEIFYNEEKIGSMKSSAGDIGLALLQIETATKALEEGVPLKAGEALLWPSLPKFL